MLSLIVIAIAIVALVGQSIRYDRRLDDLTKQERLRQDLLLNRLATRTPYEYAAVTRAQGIAVHEIPVPEYVTEPDPPLRYLYDETGLNVVVGPADIEDAAYDQAGAL
jgi:hypothetical protein